MAHSPILGGTVTGNSAYTQKKSVKYINLLHFKRLFKNKIHFDDGSNF